MTPSAQSSVNDLRSATLAWGYIVENFQQALEDNQTRVESLAADYDLPDPYRMATALSKAEPIKAMKSFLTANPDVTLETLRQQAPLKLVEDLFLALVDPED